MNSHDYLFLTLGFYTLGALHVLIQASTRRPLLPSWAVITTLAGFVVHTASLSQRWTEAGHFPAMGLHDGASFLAWAIVLVFLMTYLRTGVDAMSLAVYPVAFVLILVANLTTVSGERGHPNPQSLFLPIHTTLAFFGYAALFLAWVMGVLYLIQERELKTRSPRAFYYLVPSLSRCDSLAGRTVVIGFCFFTLAILTGLLWSHHARGHYWTGDPKEWSALVAWIIYVVQVIARSRTGWGGRRAAFLGIAGFAVVVFTFVWMTVFGQGAGG